MLCFEKGDNESQQKQVQCMRVKTGLGSERISLNKSLVPETSVWHIIDLV